MSMSMQIHRLRLPLPLRLNHLNAYLIEGPSGFALVDTGMATAEAQSALQAGLHAHGIVPAALRQLFVTHLHGDHWGQANWLGSLGVEVVMPRTDSELLDAWWRDPGYDQRSVDSHRWRGAPEAVRRRAHRALGTMRRLAPPFTADRTVEDGEILELAGEPFEVLITPGHSPGHGCLLHRPSRALLCGDHVLPDITPNVSWDADVGGNPLADYLASLHRLRRLQLSCAWPAHGEPMRDLDSRIDELLAHHREREAQLLGAFGDASLTAFEAAGHLFDLPNLDSWETWMALGETMAHLVALEREGRLQITTDDDGMERYCR
jgi:glyoxylase-like metal-dependent hydrolase (beta-lactamase superfamily II)